MKLPVAAMKFTPVVAASAALGVGILGLPLPSVGAETAPAQKAQPSDDIWAAIKNAKPGAVIRIPPGRYALLKLTGMNPGGTVTITSADPDRLAVLEGLNVGDSSDLTFKNIEVLVDPTKGFAVMLGNDNKIVFDNVKMHGAAPGDGNGAMVRKSANVSIINSEVYKVHTGLNHLDSNNLIFSNNSIHDIQSDGIRGGGSSNVTISKNFITDFYPQAQDHPDAIQFWTTNTTTPAHDLIIKDNVYIRGAGERVQGIFVGNENKIPFENVTISHNAIIGGMYQGINLSYGNRVVVEDNIVQGYDDMTSWITLGYTTNSIVQNNEATDYRLTVGNVGLVEKGNRSLRQVRKGDDSSFKRWSGKPLK